MEQEIISKKDGKALLKGFKKREKETTTGLGQGIAIPHSICPNLESPKLVVLRNSEGIDWQALDGNPVYAAIAIIVPEGGREDHFEILVEISKSMIDEKVIEKFKNGSSKEIVDLVNNIIK